MHHAAQCLIVLVALLAGYVTGTYISWFAAPGVTIIALIALRWVLQENPRA